VETKEGARALHDLIAFLRSQPAVPLLQWDESLREKCATHVEATGPLGLTTIISHDGLTLKNRIDKLGSFLGSAIGTLLQFGGLSGRSALIALAVGDGDSLKQQRKLIFGRDFTRCGASSGAHSKLKVMHAIALTGEY